MNLVFLGPPGAGKGTIASAVSREYRFPHISTGDLFRAAIKNRTPLGEKVRQITEKGDLVPDELTIQMVRERLAEADAKGGFILDGFPRTIPQAEALDAMCGIDAVINFEVDEKLIIERLSGRRVCHSCGAIFHIKFMPPRKEQICDTCGGELYTRKDDMIESIRNRLAVYNAQTAPLISYYGKRKLLINIDGSPDADSVCETVCRMLKLKKEDHS